MNSSLNVDLEQLVANWDGKSTDSLIQLFKRHSTDKQFVKNLLLTLDNEHKQVASTWLLKHYLSQGNTMHLEEQESYLQTYHQFSHWQSQLHWLQSLEYMDLSLMPMNSLDALLRYGICDDNKFVRAWSYNGLHLLACIHPELKAEYDKLFALAMVDEPASVKARLRQFYQPGASS